MGLYQSLKKLFSSRFISDEAREAYERSHNTSELLTQLDDVLTHNEVELKVVQKEYEKLEGAERAEADKIRDGEVAGRQKRYTLQAIKRLRLQLDNLEHRMAIYDRSITMNLKLIARIQDMEAMQQRGVDENKVDEILADYETQLMEFTDAAEATAESLAITSRLVEEEDAELAAIEAELAGAQAKAEEATAEAKSRRDELKAKQDAELQKLESEIKSGPEPAAPARDTETKTAEPEA
jgi:hypothetical protein